MLLDNLECFTPEQIEKICNTEPLHMIGHVPKSRFGKILEVSDFQTSGITLFKTRNSPPPLRAGGGAGGYDTERIRI